MVNNNKKPRPFSAAPAALEKRTAVSEASRRLKTVAEY